MRFVLDNLSTFGAGFRTTLVLAFVSYAAALAIGTLLAVMRISPAAPARLAGLAYVEWFRNVPLPALMFVAILCLPKMGFGLNNVQAALLVLSTYTSAQVCEALRSGVNSVAKGQAEAARAIGLTFGQNLRYVVLPQAARSVVPPLGNIFIALVKNTSVASLIGVGELTFQVRDLGRTHAQYLVTLLVATAVCYLVLTIPAGYAVSRFERRSVIVR
jgi:glutamate transport system permease protein